MRIAFFGTPDFAIPSLKILLENAHEILAVVTPPDKVRGRGNKLTPVPLKKFALDNNLQTFSPEKLKNESFLETLRELNADIFVVVAFRKLPPEIFLMPKKGCFNLHTSLLPDYRGAAPINWVIINGEKKSGVSTFFLDEKIDTGEIIGQKSVEIPRDWNAGKLHDTLMELGAELVLETVQKIENESITTKKQDNSKAIHKAPKLTKENTKTDWSQSSELIYNHIRGLSPYPLAWTILDEKILKIYQADILEEKSTGKEPGALEIDPKGNLKVATSDFWIQLNVVKLQGKKQMKTPDLLRGYQIQKMQFD